MEPVPTRVIVRALSCDAKIIGSLVGGCRVTIRDRQSGEILDSGLQLGGSGNTEYIMQTPVSRGMQRFSDGSAAGYEATLHLTEPTQVEIHVEGPLAYPHALQSTSFTTWLIPGQNVDGDGFVAQLHGFIVDIMEPQSVDVLRSHQELEILSGVRLL